MECSTKGCKKKHHAKGLCHTCYTRNKIRNKPVTKPTTKTPSKTPPTNYTHNTHRFFYYSNYNGKIEKGRKLNKKGWYELPYKHFKTILPLINSRLELGNTDRWHLEGIKRNKTRGPTISIQFTDKGKHMALGIKHFNWPTVEAMETDAYIMAQTIAAELSELNGNNIFIDNLRLEKKREIEGHITQPDKNVEKHQKEGIGNFRGQMYNPGFFTKSHKDNIQHERETDAERHRALNETLGEPEAGAPTDTVNMAYDSTEFKRFMGALMNGQYQSNESITKMAQATSSVAESLEVYGAGLTQHMAVMEDLRGMAQAITKQLQGGYTKKHLWKGRRPRR